MKSVPLKRCTYSLPVDLVERLQRLASQKKFPSANFVVRTAIVEFLSNLDKSLFEIEMAEASKDKSFLKDLGQTKKDFSQLDKENERLSDW
ncbi:hypothetical protein HYY75_02985 [bacterium]|nr:hypothetical protein [bacterium]